ncbi:FAD dependent oxidoreductase domain-containing protein [Ditylenchus destructor]|nr:FAD dependent oxidoreductase domain-containing protein [Ditylenchus destructor]
MSLSFLTEVLTVLKLVRVPPSQRWFTLGTPARSASARRCRGPGACADHQDRAALGRQLAHELQGFLERGQRLFQVDDVDLAAGAEDVRSHLGVPVAGLVAEVDAGFQHLAHQLIDLTEALTALGTDRRDAPRPVGREPRPGRQPGQRARFLRRFDEQPAPPLKPATRWPNAARRVRCWAGWRCREGSLRRRRAADHRRFRRDGGRASRRAGLACRRTTARRRGRAHRPQNLSEFAFSGVGINPHHGTPRNPVTHAIDARTASPAARPPAAPSASRPARPGRRWARTRAARCASPQRCRSGRIQEHRASRPAGRRDPAVALAGHGGRDHAIARPFPPKPGDRPLAAQRRPVLCHQRAPAAQHRRRESARRLRDLDPVRAPRRAAGRSDAVGARDAGRHAAGRRIRGGAHAVHVGGSALMRVAIIGAGLAGVTSAYELALQGHEVHVFERDTSVATGASFAPPGLIAPGLMAARPQWPMAWRGKPSHRRCRGAACAGAAWSGGDGGLAARAADGRRARRRRAAAVAQPQGLQGGRAAAGAPAGAAGAASRARCRGCRAQEPGLNAESPLHGGILLTQDEAANARQFSQALKQKRSGWACAGTSTPRCCASSPARNPAVHVAAGEPLRVDAMIVCAGRARRRCWPRKA